MKSQVKIKTSYPTRQLCRLDQVFFHSGKEVLWQTSEDPDEMPHYAAFHKALHYLQRL